MKSSAHDEPDICLSGRIFEKSYAENLLSMEDFFKCAYHNGFTSVELRDSQIGIDASSEAIDEVNILSGRYGMPVSLITARKGRLDNQEGYSTFIRYLELAKNISCRRIKISGTDLSLVTRAADKAGECDVQTGMNNHIGTPLETIDGTIEMFRKIDHPNFYLLFDPSHLWLNREGTILEFIDDVIGRIAYTIIQDYRESDNGKLYGTRRIVPVSTGETGSVGYREIIQRLLSRNFKGPFALVYLGDGNRLRPGTGELKNHYMRYLTDSKERKQENERRT